MSEPPAADPARAKCTNLFGPAVPHMDVRFPKDMPITVVEFLVYFRNGLRNRDPLRRFIQAILDQTTAARILNFYRRWDKRPALG